MCKKMKGTSIVRVLRPLILIMLIALASCQGQRSASVAKAERNLEELNHPHFKTVEDAAIFAQKEENLLSYNGLILGSEQFNVKLPSGRETSNWRIDCFFGWAFSGFQKPAIPVLIEMLDHEYQFVRLGAYYKLMQKAGRYDTRYHFTMSKDERRSSVDAWRKWWRDNKDNPRLDTLPKRCYKAEDWELEKGPDTGN